MISPLNQTQLDTLVNQQSGSQVERSIKEHHLGVIVLLDMLLDKKAKEIMQINVLKGVLQSVELSSEQHKALIELLLQLK